MSACQFTSCFGHTCNCRGHSDNTNSSNQRSHDISLNEYYRNYYQTYYAQQALNQTTYSPWQTASDARLKAHPHTFATHVHDGVEYRDGWPVDQQSVEKNKAKMKQKAKEGSSKNDEDEQDYVGHYVAGNQTPTMPEGRRSDGKYHYNFYGRSREEVDEDMHHHAHAGGAWKIHEFEPRGAQPHQPFWVLHSSYPGGRCVLPLSAIKSFRGSWHMDPRHGNQYFIRAEEGVGDGSGSD